MTVHSSFRLWAILPVTLLLLVTVGLVFVVEKLFERHSPPPFAILLAVALFIFTWIWVLFGELRTKVIKVYIESEELIVSNYCGLGAKRIYSIPQFDGFETALLPSRYDTYEYLYLMENGKKVVKLSQFYHSNYEDLKQILSSKIQNLGQKRFSYLQEIKEIFT